MVSQKARSISPFIVMDVLERAQQLERQGKDIIHLEIGEPDFDTPERIRQAGIEAIRSGKTHYTHSLGIPELREAIAEHYQRRYGVALSPDRVIVTMGTSPALLLALCALVDEGDEVVITDPRYACYPNFLRQVSAVARSVRLWPEDGFDLHPEALREALTSRTKAVIINSPANPTGRVLSAKTLGAVAEITNMGPFLISDEIYHGLVYGAREHTILEFTDRAFVINGFSKYYAMTGWRLGFLIAPEEFVRPIQKLQQNLFVCASSIAQWAGVVALTEHHPELDEAVRTYDLRRRYMLQRLREIGFKVYGEPQGAFYILADARHICSDSYQLASEILEQALVAVAPGIDFGPGAEGFIRFSYANSIENIRRGLDRIQAYLRSREERTAKGTAAALR
ncbi:MAG: pyridoxal phosphate-dependent aminotransferase [candidate division KSB1 bacterium]|nr:pyridoxal phosphate-dependent aminotransferase [candidate division KSB1 bacterium]